LGARACGNFEADDIVLPVWRSKELSQIFV
jgi:hypothetical protein